MPVGGMTFPYYPKENIMYKIFHEKMISVANSHKLPEYFKDDLEYDLCILNNYKGCRFIWLLRTSGTVLFPLEIGADPVHITHWLDNNNDERKTAFLVDPEKNVIELISFELTEKLIFKKPTELSSFLSMKALEKEVCNILDNGIEKGVWGVFKKPKIKSDDWISCRNYYKNANNHLMSSYMDKAIHLRNSLIQSQSSAAAA
jgi:hypothetical protein